MKLLKLLTIALLIIIPLSLFADDNVMSSDQLNSQPSAVTTDSATPNATQLAQQVQYIQQMNLPDKIQQLQQAIQDLRGIVEMQGHTISQLAAQQKSLYADLDQRMNALSSKQATLVTTSTPQTSIPAIPTTPAVTTPVQQQVSTPPVASDETQAYQAAFASIQNKQYSSAIDAFNKYLLKYPKGQFVANANYWLGELYAIAGQNDKAIQALNTVVNAYPQSDKVPDAMLKLGSMAYAASNWQQAKQWWTKIVTQYPDSTAARLAKVQLLQLQREGH